MAVPFKLNPGGKARKRPFAADKQDDEQIRNKNKSKRKKNTKKQKKNEASAIVISKDVKVSNNVSPTPLMESIFGGNSSFDGTRNSTIGTPASSSLIDSIFDHGNIIPTATNISSSTMSLFDNPKIAPARNHHRQLLHRKKEHEKPNKAKAVTATATAAVAAATETNTTYDAESIHRTLRNRKCRSQRRPLLRKALDFPGVFSNEEKDEEKGAFLLDDENERAKETADAVRDHGFCVLRNVMDNNNKYNNNGDTHHPLRDGVLPVANDLQRRLNASLKARGIHHSTETFRFREAASRCKGRTDVVFDAFEQDKRMIDVKRKVLRNPKLFPVIRNLLGGASSSDSNDDDDDDDDSDTNGDIKLVYAGLIFSYPGSCDQPWHQDGVPLFPELPRKQSALLQASLPPYALNVFLPLEDEDGSIEKGPTELLPGSHKWTSPDERLRLIVEKSNGEEKEEESDTDDAFSVSDDDTNNIDKAIIAPVLKQGDALIYDYRVCHRGTANLFGELAATKNNASVTNADIIPGRKKKEKQNSRDRESGVSGTRRILYLMYARPWFTDHVNFDYKKSAKSLWDDHKPADNNLSKNTKHLEI